MKKWAFIVLLFIPILSFSQDKLVNLQSWRVKTPEIEGGTTYNDLQVSSLATKTPASGNPTWESVTIDGFTFLALAFDTNDSVTIYVQTDHSVELNTVIENHVHWFMTSDDAGDEIKFSIKGVAAPIGGAITAITPIESDDYTLLEGDGGKHHLLDIGDIEAVNSTISTVYVLRLTRIPPTDGTGSAELVYLLFNDCHVSLNSFGSDNEDSK